jgi:putative DNA primase/helicase
MTPPLTETPEELVRQLMEINDRLVREEEEADRRAQWEEDLDDPPPAAWPEVVRLSDVDARAVEWLWPGWVPLGKLTLLDGEAGAGKSSVLLDLAARVSRDGTMPDGSAGAAGGVLLVADEDGNADGLQPRLAAAGARLERVHALRLIRDDGGPRPVRLPEDLPLLEEAVAGRDVRLMALDPLAAVLGGGWGMRQARAGLAALAERKRCAVVGVRPLAGGRSSPTASRGVGGPGLLGAARARLVLATDPGRPGGRVLAVAKCNLAARPAARRLGLEPTPEGVCRVVWGGPVEGDADELAAGPAAAEERSKEQLAMEFLRFTLRLGPETVRSCGAKAAELGISRRTLGRAARTLGLVLTFADPLGLGRHTWRLPDGAGPLVHVAS